MTVKLYLRKGSLFGYNVKQLAKKRRDLLMRIIKKNMSTYAQIMRRLNVLAIFNKNKNPKLSKKVRTDMAYLRRQFRKPTKKMKKKKPQQRRSKRGTKRPRRTKMQK
jgi:hypothetical protein